MENIQVKEICPTTAQAWVKNGALLVDVREPEEVSELAYDVPEIMHIPLTEFEERYTEIPKDRAVVVVCRSGGRSLRAAGFLIYHGFDPERVVNMQHGMIRWAQKGFPVIGNIESVLATDNGAGCCASDKKDTENTCC